MNLLLAATLVLITALNGFPQDKPAAQDDHHQGVVERGDHVMGFSHDKAAHHFLLYPDGGAIDVQANTADDTATRDEIRMSFGHIAKMFAAGDFSAPMLIHSSPQRSVPDWDISIFAIRSLVSVTLLTHECVVLHRRALAARQ